MAPFTGPCWCVLPDDADEEDDDDDADTDEEDEDGWMASVALMMCWKTALTKDRVKEKTYA